MTARSQLGSIMTSQAKFHKSRPLTVTMAAAQLSLVEHSAGSRGRERSAAQSQTLNQPAETFNESSFSPAALRSDSI